MSQSDLARRCGVTRAAVSLWMSGSTHTLEGANLTRAALALWVNAHWLASGEGRPSVQGTGNLGESAPEELVKIKRLFDLGKLSKEDLISILTVSECLAGMCDKSDHDATKAVMDLVTSAIRHN